MTATHVTNGVSKNEAITRPAATSNINPMAAQKRIELIVNKNINAIQSKATLIRELLLSCRFSLHRSVEMSVKTEFRNTSKMRNPLRLSFPSVVIARAYAVSCFVFK